MGVTPDPPSTPSSTSACTRGPTCSAELHFWDCERAARLRREADARKACSNHGHEWSITRTPHLDTPVAARCVRCNKTFKMVESES